MSKSSESDSSLLNAHDNLLHIGVWLRAAAPFQLLLPCRAAAAANCEKECPPEAKDAAFGLAEDGSPLAKQLALRILPLSIFALTREFPEHIAPRLRWLASPADF